MLDSDFTGKRVLIRADLNLPMQGGVILDEERLQRFLPTLKAIQAANPRQIVILSHLGRPKGWDKKYSLKPIYDALKKYHPDIVFYDQDIRNQVPLSSDDMILLENIRFYGEETKNDPDFVKILRGLGDVYVNDAFSCSHREHASIYGIAKALPSFPGLQIQAELNALEKGIEKGEKPILAIVGGSKISTKMGVLENLLQKVDYLVVSGAMALTFHKSLGKDIGKSLVEDDYLDLAKRLYDQYQDKLYIGDDFACHTALEKTEKAQRVEGDIPNDLMALDFGPKSIEHVLNLIKKSKTVLWNGTLGAYEFPPFDQGSIKVAHALAQSNATTIAGGGDTLALLKKAGIQDQLTYTSTAGGAFLEWLEGKDLPGLSVLNKENSE